MNVAEQINYKTHENRVFITHNVFMRNKKSYGEMIYLSDVAIL